MWIVFVPTYCHENLGVILHCSLLYLFYQGMTGSISAPKLCALIVACHQNHATSCCQTTGLATFETSSHREVDGDWFEVECLDYVSLYTLT